MALAVVWDGCTLPVVSGGATVAAAGSAAGGNGAGADWASGGNAVDAG